MNLRIESNAFRLCAATVLLQFAGMNEGMAASIDFSELAGQPENGMSVRGLSLEGVTFGFQVNGADSNDAYFGFDGPDGLTHLQGQVLEGNAGGTLAINFDAPQTHIAFGLGFNVFKDLKPGAFVSLFDAASNLVLSQSLDTHTLVDFSEGNFVYNGSAVSRLVLDLNVPGERFALDNLEFLANGSLPVPEGAPGWVGNLAIAGFLGLSALSQKGRAFAQTR